MATAVVRILAQRYYHVLLRNGVGMMASFVDKKRLHDQNDLLSAQAQWDVNYGLEHASKVESNVRYDLIGSNTEAK
jgi:hypothetical protein